VKERRFPSLHESAVINGPIVLAEIFKRDPKNSIVTVRRKA
jgi:hypothetical protein